MKIHSWLKTTRKFPVVAKLRMWHIFEKCWHANVSEANTPMFLSCIFFIRKYEDFYFEERYNAMWGRGFYKSYK